MEEFNYENCVELLNIYQYYYNSLYKKNENMFHGINENNGTNRSLEIFYDLIFSFNKGDEEQNRICEPDENTEDLNEIYGFTIDNEIVKVGGSMISLLVYINKNYDWCNKKWTIIIIK
jgi:hypothetical protein